MPTNILAAAITNGRAVVVSRVFNRTVVMSASKATTAAIVVIGDEILKGYTNDTNSTFICQRLFEHQVDVKRIAVVPDQVDVIAAQVKQFSGEFDHVITSGGVGPTHDDVTYEGIARAFDDTCEVNEELASIVRKYFSKQHPLEAVDDPKGGFMKLAAIPRSSRLLWGRPRHSGQRSLYPVVRVGNVTVLPGVPHLLRRAFDMNLHEFTGDEDAVSRVRRRKRVLYSGQDEFYITDQLSSIAAANRDVNIGSYPDLKHSYYRVQITVDSADDARAAVVYQQLQQQLQSFLIAFDENPIADCVGKLDAFIQNQLSINPEFGRLLQNTRQIIEDGFNKFGANKSAVSFNGGKDCTALLHLVYVVFRSLQSSGKVAETDRLQVLYIKPAETFPDIDKFIDETVKRYSLRLLAAPDQGGLRQTLHQLTQDHPDLQAVFLGGRRQDPGHANLQPMQYTDPGWPRLLRVHALLDWTYSDVWTLLRGLYVPYCSLYDAGYTSVGCVRSTVRNEALAYEDGLGVRRYRPAHTLHDDALERAGRKQPPKPAVSDTANL